MTEISRIPSADCGTMCRVQDQMLEKARELCPNLSFMIYQLNPFIAVPIEDA